MKFKSLIAVCALLFAVNASAQETVSEHPANVQGYETWTQVDSGGSSSFYFYFTGKKNAGENSGRSQYSGYDALYVYTDSASTATQGTPTYDSLKIDVYTIEWDEVSDAWERCQTGQCTADKDSTNVLDWASWGTNHSDDRYTKIKVLNVPLADGIEVVVQSRSDINIRLEHKQAKNN